MCFLPKFAENHNSVFTRGGKSLCLRGVLSFYLSPSEGSLPIIVCTHAYIRARAQRKTAEDVPAAKISFSVERSYLFGNARLVEVCPRHLVVGNHEKRSYAEAQRA